MTSQDLSVQVDDIGHQQWWDLGAAFQDANLYQFWHDGIPSAPFNGLSRLVLWQEGNPMAGAETRLFLVPIVKRGIAYVRWGPLWRSPQSPADANVFRQAVRALRDEYVRDRQMILRITPRLFLEDDRPCIDVLRQEGFESLDDSPTERTLLVDLTPDLEKLRQSLDKKWRNCLSKAERSMLTVERGTELTLFDDFGALYREMLDRKQFVPTADFDRHRRLQRTLPDGLKMQVFIARESGQPCAGAIISSLGGTGIYLFGATNASGMQSCASYLLQWEVVKFLKGQGIPHYDLHGINPLGNPGTYHFKKGLAGKNGRELTFAGRFQVYRPTFTNRSILLLERWRRRSEAPPQPSPEETSSASESKL